MKKQAEKNEEIKKSTIHQSEHLKTRVRERWETPETKSKCLCLSTFSTIGQQHPDANLIVWASFFIFFFWFSFRLFHITNNFFFSLFFRFVFVYTQFTMFNQNVCAFAFYLFVVYLFSKYWQIHIYERTKRWNQSKFAIALLTSEKEIELLNEKTCVLHCQTSKQRKSSSEVEWNQSEIKETRMENWTLFNDDSKFILLWGLW